MRFKTFLQIFAGIAVLLTLFRFIAIDYWWIRMFDFPHIQLTALTVTAFIAYFMKFDLKKRGDYIFAFVLLGCMIYQFGKIYLYTPLASYELLDATTSQKNNQIKLLTANVLQKNEEKNHLVSLIEKADADLLLFTETDQKWRDAIVEGLSSEYRYRVEIPLDNTYGMLMYSKFELINPEKRYQVDDSIPSIQTKLRMPSGDLIEILAIHPTPPMPQENPKSSERDREMMLTAFTARKSQLPVMVIGDFNDVSWSQTTTLFQTISGLLDPRIGRGFYNTFSAKNPILRWPLDHIFVSPEFRLSSISVGKKINSDHFPLLATLSLEPNGASEQTPEPPSDADLKDAKDQMKENDLLDLGID